MSTVQHPLVQHLRHGPLDLVGDVHGEIDALRSLLDHLGYSGDGTHPEDRHLVFLGDLTDRGSDSPAVVELVQRLIESERAQCVMGNHDLNILLEDRKHDNHWFFGEEWSLEGEGHPVTPAELADDALRKTVKQFFAKLPLALERDDLRVVHACWDDDAVEIARDANDAVVLYEQHKKQIEAEHSAKSNCDESKRNLDLQNRNPVKVLTSGKEQPSKEPFFASGKWRDEERVSWWADDEDDRLCVFGHYSIPDGEYRGTDSTFCVDFGVAKRWTERRIGTTGGFTSKLAALRLREQIVVFDEGERRSACLPSWKPGGGVVLDVYPPAVSWPLPDAASRLSSFHITLVGRR